MDEFFIGQIFDEVYPPEAAVWCNKNNAHIEKVDERYIIAENPPPPEMRKVRTFSKFAIWVATQDMPLTLPDGTSSNLWAEFEKFMRNTKLEKGESLYSGWKNLNDLVEDNQFFEEFYPLAIEAFGKELVDSVLEASVSKVENKIK